MKSLVSLALCISFVGAIALIVPGVGSSDIIRADGFTNESFEDTNTTTIDYDISGLSGTVWQEYLQINILPIPSIFLTDYKLHFYDGRVYYDSEVYVDAFYVDLLDASLYFDHSLRSIETGIMFPAIGRGISMVFGLSCLGIPYLHITLHNKIDDNWTPPGQIMSISPNQGEQGTTITDIQLTCIDTTFKDDGVSKILFIPDGLTVSNIKVISNTEIEFDLEIAVDAPIGERWIYVVYSDAVHYVDVCPFSSFIVTEKMN